MSNNSVREVIGSPIKQGPSEKINYQIEFANWGTPTSASTTVYELDTNTDSSSTCLSGSPVISGTAVSSGTIQSLTGGKTYRMVVSVDIGSNTMSAYCDIYCESL